MNTATRTTREPEPQPTTRVVEPPLRRFSVEEYHRIGEAGIFGTREKCELIRGLIVEKPVINPPHATVVAKLTRRLIRLLGDDRVVRSQSPITLSDSEPEPDIVVAAGTEDAFAARHPRPKEIFLVVEVSDSSLGYDQTTKLALYAAAKVPVYWIINIPARRLEVYTQPRGGKKPSYRHQTNYGPGEIVPIVVGGVEVGGLGVGECFP